MPFSCVRISQARGTRRVGIIPLEDASQRYLARLGVVTVALAWAQPLVSQRVTTPLGGS